MACASGGMKTLSTAGFEGGHMRTAYEEAVREGREVQGIQVVPLDDYVAAVRELNRLGWRVATHAVGDAAIDQVLTPTPQRTTTARSAQALVGRALLHRPARHYPRVKALDLVSRRRTTCNRAGPSLIKYWGRERAEQVTPVRSFLDRGILVAGGTDSPVIPYNPFWAMYHFISREDDLGRRLRREPAHHPRGALRIFTINNAKLTFEEDLKGSIERGKLADLVILPADILIIPEKQIEALRPVATMVGGRFRVRRPGGTSE